MNTYYVAAGPVRGCCGHAHRNVHAAFRCCNKDHRACQRLPGGHSYSDRSAHRSDCRALATVFAEECDCRRT